MTYKIPKYSILFLLLIFVSSMQAQQISEAEADSIARQFDLDEVTVSARYKEKDIIKPQRLEGKELEKLNSLSVADAIRFFSGVQIKDYGGVGGIKTVNIRSMGTNHMGV